MKKSANVVRFKGKVASRGAASALLQEPGDAALVERGRPRLLLLSCPCGCGQQFPINLDPRAGPAWRMYWNGPRELSLYPSVWRESDCMSHYVIWRNKIFLFGRYEDDLDSSPQPDEMVRLVDLVRERLPEKSLVSFFEIAEELDAIPWDVLMVCRRLVRAGTAREGTGKQRGSFVRIKR
jgi:hypothetical protein